VKIAIIGAQGQIGAELVSAAADLGWETQSLDHSQVEIQDKSGLEEALATFGPDYVINTAAYHNVAECEASPSLAKSINDLGSRNVAEVADSLNARTVYFSTDYVFDGVLEFGKKYLPTDTPAPINVYGASKLAGERSCLEVSGDNLVVRISSVFGIRSNRSKGGNFIDKILARIQSGENATVPDDNRMSPTYAVDAAAATLALVQHSVSGVWHASNPGSVSWFELAKEIGRLAGLEDRILVSTAPSQDGINRPKNSTLDTSGTSDYFESQDWRTAVKRYLEEKGAA
jgi:dTDP-4-dehydrorhamnose reductase